MIYLSGGTPPELRGEVARLGWGYMLAPAAGVRLGLVDSLPWAADNGCFTTAWNAETWTAWLRAMMPARERCLFAVVPDVVADAAATRARWDEYKHIPRSLGYRLAFVTQDGCTTAMVPWSEAGAIFTGGSTAWKRSEPAFALIGVARSRGLWTHMGRVNSQRRLRAAYAGGYASCDGTYMAFNPAGGVRRLGEFLVQLRRQGRLEVPS